MSDPAEPRSRPVGRDSGWQGSAAAMDRWQRKLRGAGARATERMIERAGIGPGQRVLDVAAGNGVQTVPAAERVGDGGFVLATDISEDMARFAAARAKDAGSRNVGVAVMDAAKPAVADGCFDAALCRMGLMLFPDPRGALNGMRAALRPDGRMAAMVFSTAERNPMQAVPLSIIRERLGIAPPEPGQPGYFSLGAPGVLATMIEDAGFTDVKVEAVAGDLRLDSLADLLTYMRERSGGVRALMARADDETRATLWRDIEQAMARFDTGRGCFLPQEFLVASACRPD